MSFRTDLAKLLAEQGRVAEAEALYRETVKRFPDNVVSRAALAKLLTDEGRAAEAEALYRDTVKRSPDNDVSRNALANLLAEQGKTAEAEALYRKTMQHDPRDAVSRLDLGLMLIDLNRIDEVEPILAQLQALKHSAARTLAAHMSCVRKGEPRPGQDGTKSKRVETARNPSDLPADAALTGLSASANAMRAALLLSPVLDDKSLLLMTPERHRELRDEARGLLEHLLRERPDHPVVRMVAYRYGKVEKPGLDPELLSASPDDYALHLEAARHRRGEGAFAGLAKRFPTCAPLTHLVCLVDEVPDAVSVAAGPLLSWLKVEPKTIANPILRYLHAHLFEALGRPRIAQWVAADLTDTLDDRCAPETLHAIIDVALLGLVGAKLSWKRWPSPPDNGSE